VSPDREDNRVPETKNHIYQSEGLGIATGHLARVDMYVFKAKGRTYGSKRMKALWVRRHGLGY